MRKIITLAAAFLLLMSWSAVGSADTGSVKILGDEHFVPNALVSATFRFAPGPLTASQGGSVTWDNTAGAASADEPHTIAIVAKDRLPGSINEVFGCGAPGTPCFDVFNTLSANVIVGATPPCAAGSVAVAMPGAPAVCIKEQINAAGSAAGLDAVGDVLLVGAGSTSDWTISAAHGTTLYYFCAFHPWMQGSISVR